MTDHEAAFASLWCDYCEGKIAGVAWQDLLLETPGLHRWVRQQSDREMLKQKREAHRGMGWR